MLMMQPHAETQPDVRRVALTPADRFFLLACDGIWDVMSNQQVPSWPSTSMCVTSH